MMALGDIHFHDAHPGPVSLFDEVVRGLKASPKFVPPKFFYDTRGSELFDAICDLPEYYPTRTEMQILQACAADIAERVGSGCALIELGSGASQKVRLLLDVLRPATYMAVDISKDFLLRSTRELSDAYPWLEIHAVCADFSQGVKLPSIPPASRKLAFFPGSSIGNFEPHDAEAFLRRLKGMLSPGGALLIGVDLKKAPEVLDQAYNDTRGLTAKFNLNLLTRLRRELDAELDTTAFSHDAFYNETKGRVEMHLVSQRKQDIKIDGHRFSLEKGESIHTENSYKYTVEEFRALARRAGYDPEQTWCDHNRLFSVHYLSAG